MCSDERSSRRTEMQSGNNHNDSLLQRLQSDEFGEQKKEGNFMHFKRRSENNQNEFVKEGNLLRLYDIGDEEKENEDSGDMRSYCENDRNEFVKEGNFMHFTEIRDEEEETEKSEDLQSLCENNQKEIVKKGNFMHFHEFCDESDQNEESGDLWSLCEPARNHFESLVGYDGLSPVSNPEPRGAQRNFLCNNSLHFCTESLGFESSDEREDCNAVFSENLGSFREENVEVPDVAAEKLRYAPGHSHMVAKKRVTFPPPLTWLKSPILLKPSRKDGRFIIREVDEHEAPTPRHEILHAWRKNGRLRLHLISKKLLYFIDTSMQSDTSSGDNGLDAEPRLTLSLPSVDENSVPRPPGIWSATWENESVEFPRADVSLPLFVVPVERCQESTTCLSTWNPRCITT